MRERERKGEIDWQINRQTDREADIETGRKKIDTERERLRETEIERYAAFSLFLSIPCD